MHIKVASNNDAINLSKHLNNGNWMVLYYADWCGHCKTMKPEWDNVIKSLNNPQTNTNNVNVAEIESQHIENLVNKPDIKGFPTIKMYNNGLPIANFEDERIASKIKEFAINNSKIEDTKPHTKPHTNHHTKHHTKPHTKNHSKHHSKHHTKNNDVKYKTKSVFNQLIKSFDKIGSEAEKDSILLKKATNNFL